MQLRKIAAYYNSQYITITYKSVVPKSCVNLFFSKKYENFDYCICDLELASISVERAS